MRCLTPPVAQLHPGVNLPWERCAQSPHKQSHLLMWMWCQSGTSYCRRSYFSLPRYHLEPAGGTSLLLVSDRPGYHCQSHTPFYTVAFGVHTTHRHICNNPKLSLVKQDCRSSMLRGLQPSCRWKKYFKTSEISICAWNIIWRENLHEFRVFTYLYDH